MLKKYNAEIVAGALLPIESRLIAKLLLEGVSEEELYRLITIENVLQKRSPGTAIRKTELIRKRLDTVEKHLIEIIASDDRPAATQGLLIGAIKHNNLIGDFMARVVKEKWRAFGKKLRLADWEEFLRECEQIDPTVKNWQPTTREKLGQVVRKCLVEAGYLENSRTQIITPTMLAPEIRQYLLDHNEHYVLNCMDIFNNG